MQQWSALFKKDFKLSRTVFVIGLVMNVLIAVLTLYLERIAGDSLLMFVPLAIAGAAHVLYVPIIVFTSLNREGNHLALWLGNPQSASKLLMSKAANGLIMMVISLTMLYALSGLLMLPEFSLIEPYWDDAWRMGLFIFPHLIWISIMIGVWVMALWALYHCLKMKIGRWSLAAVALAAILSGELAALIKSSAPYPFLVEWGSITYKFPTIMSEQLQTYSGEYIYDAVIIVGLFLLTAWLVDRKVEG